MDRSAETTRDDPETVSTSGGIGGRAAGLVLEGDRRFQIIVRLPDALRSDMEVLENLPIAVPQTSLALRPP